MAKSKCSPKVAVMRAGDGPRMTFTAPVVLFCGGLAADGVARNTVHLANALARRRIPVEIVCLTTGALAGELRGPAVTVLPHPQASRGLALTAAVPALHRRLAALRPSVVVSMGNHAHLGAWAALRGLPDTPRIYRISNDPGHHGRDPRRRRMRELGLRLVAADATRVVCVSGAIAATPLFRRARRDRRVDVLPNGVDAQAVLARAAEPVRHPWIEDGRPFLAAVGRLHPQKNYESLIDALAVARSQGAADLRLLVLGAAPARRLRPLRRRIEALGLGPAVRFEGEVANPFPLVARAAAYVLPSLWEGASNSLLEAMACGAPVAVSRTAGNAAEVLEHGRYGVLADPEDPRDLARAVLRQVRSDTRILPGARAGAFDLAAVTDRLCAIVLGARRAHDEIQMSREGAAHAGLVGDEARGPHKEY